MLDQLFNSKTRVKVLSLFQSNPESTYYLQEIARLTKTDPASIHRELGTLEEMNLMESKNQGNQKYFKVNIQNPYWKNIEKLIAIYKNADQNRWFYYTDSKDIFPLIHFSTVDEKLNQIFFKKIKVELGSYDFASLRSGQKTDMWLKYDQCNEIEQKFKKIFFENPSQILDLCKESIQAGENLKKFSIRWEKLNFSNLTPQELAQEIQDFVDIHGKFEIYHWLHSILETGNLVIDRELQTRMKILNKQNYLSDFGALTNVFESSGASDQYDDLLLVLDSIQKNKLAEQFFKSTELRLIQKNLWDKHPQLYLKIKKHANDFGYLGFGRIGPAWSENYFIEILKHLVNTGTEVSDLKLKNDKRLKILKQTQSELEKSFYNDLSLYFKAYRACIKTKIFRKEVTHFCYQFLAELLKELSNKTNCTISELQQMYQHELSDLMSGKKLNKEFLLSKSLEHLLLRENHDSIYYIAPHCLEVLDKIQLPKSENAVFYGKCFVAGRARGQSLIYKTQTKKIPNSSILIIDAKIKNLKSEFLKNNLENILGIIFLGTPISDSDSLVFTRQYNIPCVFDLELQDFDLENKLLDLDATYGKMSVIHTI